MMGSWIIAKSSPRCADNEDRAVTDETMLTKRIIPCLDVKDGRVVKGVSFVNLRDAGDPVEVATLYNREGADELCFLDTRPQSSRDHTHSVGHPDPCS